MPNNTAQHLNCFRYENRKTLKRNSGEVLDQKIVCEAEEVMLLAK